MQHPATPDKLGSKKHYADRQTDRQTDKQTDRQTNCGFC
jgi:hypothetical protein